MSKLVVYAVGDLVTDIVEGDSILVDPSKLSGGLLVPLTSDKNVLLISSFDVIHVW
jgi:hypothetical protein